MATSMLPLTHLIHAYRAISCFFVCENMSFSSTTGATYPSAYRSRPHTAPTSPRGTIVILSTGDAPSVSSDTIACPHSCSLRLTPTHTSHSVIRSTSRSFPRDRLLPIWMRSSDSNSAPLMPTVRRANCFRSTSSARRVYPSTPTLRTHVQRLLPQNRLTRLAVRQ